MTKPHVMRGATSPGQQCWMGKRDKSTSSPSHTTSWHGAERSSLGAIFHRVLSMLRMPTISLKPLGASGSLSDASNSPKGRSPLTDATPMARATRSGVPLHPRRDVVLSDRYTVGSYFDERMRELRGQA